MKSAREKIQELLHSVNIEINGSNPWDMQVYNDHLFRRIVTKGSLGAGESYMDGWWDSEKLDEFFTRVIRGRIPDRITMNFPTLWLYLKSSFLNMQTNVRAKKVAQEHYNLGNDLYMSFLDPYNQYTCGYFKETEDLNIAQQHKLDLICKKLQLSETDSVLDIGCGWGGFAKFAAENYGCKVTGISISEEQIKYARNFCRHLPVEIHHKDYRDLDGQYDKVLICGMIEHVGYKNYRTILNKVYDVMHDKGLFLLHTIGCNQSQRTTDPWMSKYIFPNSMTPSVNQITHAAEGLFVMEDWHNIGVHYVKTLKAWYHNFHDNWDTLKSNYNDRFYRMWKYYLLGSVGHFESRTGQLWQVVFSKNGVKGGYESIR